VLKIRDWLNNKEKKKFNVTKVYYGVAVEVKRIFDDQIFALGDEVSVTTTNGNEISEVFEIFEFYEDNIYVDLETEDSLHIKKIDINHIRPRKYEDSQGMAQG